MVNLCWNYSLLSQLLLSAPLAGGAVTNETFSHRRKQTVWSWIQCELLFMNKYD